MEHLKFKDLEINGNIHDFICNLQELGFSVLTQIDDYNITILQGLFAGLMCDIYVAYSPISKTVWKVSVHVSNPENWVDIKNKYNLFFSFSQRNTEIQIMYIRFSNIPTTMETEMK